MLMGSLSFRNMIPLACSILGFLVMVGIVIVNGLSWLYLLLLVLVFLPQFWFFWGSGKETDRNPRMKKSLNRDKVEEGFLVDHSPNEKTEEGESIEAKEENMPLGKMGSRNFDREVLLVEDNADYKQVTVLLLKSMGLRIDEANNGKIAFEMAQEKRYDLILMDMNMPTMGGLRATQLIRHAKGPNMATPIIALTSHTDVYNREKCYEAGMNSFLVKSCSIEELVEELDLVFEQTTMMEIQDDSKDK